jgi:hypothetical protein
MNNIYFHTTYITLGKYLYKGVRVFTIKDDCENLYIQNLKYSNNIIKVPFNELSLKEIDNINKENNLLNYIN